MDHRNLKRLKVHKHLTATNHTVNHESGYRRKRPVARVKKYTYSEKRILVLVILELGAALEWDFETLIEHLRHTHWEKPLDLCVNKAKAEELGWTVGDSLMLKFNKVFASKNGGNQFSRVGSSLKNQWQQISRTLFSVDSFLDSTEMQVSKDSARQFGIALEMDSSDVKKLSLTVCQRIKVIAGKFLKATTRTPKKRKADELFDN